jgi:filamentous hemagglutinin family protein
VRSTSYSGSDVSRRCKGAAHALAVACACVLAGNASANPTGAEIVAGQVDIAASPNRLLITNSPGAIINWQSFSILPGELTQFIQQSSSSSVLNRITGQDPTAILGALQSNGKVFLINPNGIVFGAGARVDVNGLVASTLNLSNTDFQAGKLRFDGTSAAGDVSNQGAITTPSGGQVYLIGSSVTNGGVITSPGGDVVLAAGQSVDLADSNVPDVRVVISAPGSEALNVGQVVAASGRVGIYGALVNQMGLVSANSAVAGENGKIIFKSSGDTLLGAGSVTTATGAGSGGSIEVTGSRVALTDDAIVDVSGQTGGGTVLIGGDERGSNPTMQNAARTYVGSTTQIKADALRSGDGGKVIVWSDQQTRMYGNVSARGAGHGGNGGFVEISSKGFLDFHGVADLRASSGASGTLLLDPSDITIQAGPSSVDVTVSGSGPFDITAASAISVLSTMDLYHQLALGNVVVSTSSNASAPNGGTITVAGPLSWSTSNTLRLEAEQGIAINAPITAAAGTLNLFTANGDIVQIGGPITAAAVVAIAQQGSVQLTDQNNAVGLIAGSANGLLGFSLVNNGSFTVGTVPGFGQAAAVSGITSTNPMGYGVVLQTPDAGDITVAAPVDAGSSRVLVAGAGAVVQGAGGLISAGSLIVNAGGAAGVGSSDAPLQTAVSTLRSAATSGSVHISNSGDLTVTHLDAADAVNVSTNGSLTTPFGSVCDCAPGIAGSSVVLAASGSMLLNMDADITGTNEVALYAGYDAASGTYTSDGSLTVDANVSGSTIGLFAGAEITGSGTLTGAVTETPSLYSALPSLAQCIATPSLPGCSAVLPTLATCAATPAAPGCSVVLPTLAICTASPTTAGCGAVLPTFATCTTTPSLLGCAVVLPPTPIVQTPTIILATSTVVVAANAQGNTPASGTPNPTVSSTSKTSSTSSDGDKSDSKSDSKTDSKKESATKDISEAKNEPARNKLFCN